MWKVDIRFTFVLGESFFEMEIVVSYSDQLGLSATEPGDRWTHGIAACGRSGRNWNAYRVEDAHVLKVCLAREAAKT